jgi:hypothetical protein
MEMYSNIINGKIQWSPGMGAALKDLILNILQTSEEKRYDIGKIRSHFFYSVNEFK